MTEHFIFFFYVQLPSLPHTLLPILFPLGYPAVHSFFFNVRFRRAFHCYLIATLMALQLPNLWLLITELPQTGFYLSRSSHPVFLPTEAVCLTLWNPRKPLSGLPTLCFSLRSVLSRFHASTLPHFSALIFHCFGPSPLWLLISDFSFLITHRLCSLAAITSRRVWLLFLRLSAVVSVLQFCFRPKQVSSFFIAVFFPRLGPSLSNWPLIHLCCRSNRCLIRHLLPLSFRFLLLSFKSFCPLQSMHSKSEDPFLRWFHTFVDCYSHHPTTDFATVFVHFDPNSPP